MLDATTQVTNLEIILNFASKNQGLFMFIVAMISLAIGLVGFLIYKLVIFFVRKAKLDVGFGDKRLKLNTDDSNDQNDSSDSTLNQTLDTKINSNNLIRLTSTISAIVTDAVDNGYKKSEKRENLFKVQMNKIEESFDTAQAYIIEEYIKSGGANVEVAKALLSYSLRKHVITPYRHIMEADGLVQKTKDGVIEANRNFIDSCYMHVYIEFKNFTNYSTTGKPDNLTLTFSDEVLLKCLEHQKDIFRKLLVDSLEFAYDEELRYIEEIAVLGKALDDKITKLLSIHLNAASEDIGSKSWVSPSAATPPKSITGV